MNRKTVIGIVGLFAVLAFVAGYLAHRPAAVTDGNSGGRRILYYVDPMHPAYRSDKPGIAPDCGMQLTPVYADGGAAAGGDAGLPSGAIRISPEQQQLIGVKSLVVEKSPVTHQVRVLGRVVPDEGRIYRINSSLAGFVKEVSPVTTGSFVKRDQYLASIYSPDLYAVINSYIFSLNSIDRQNRMTPENIKLLRQDLNIRANWNSLINIGMSETQLEEVMRTRFNKEAIDIRATEAGYLLVRNISLGERFERGVEFYRIADLSRVWILADIFENEASYFTPGVRCTARLPHRNLSFAARVANVLPLYDPVTRTLKVRLETENSGMVLRPEMFVDLELPVNLPAMVTIPREALLDTGLKQTVFMDRGNGIFEPRAVEAGRHFDDRVEIVKGLLPGEKIVVSGNFLLDSESRLKNSSAGISGTPGKDPVCGMALMEEWAKAAGLARQFAGKTYYFCGPEDMAKFDKAPKRYTGPHAATEPMPMGSAASSPRAHSPAGGDGMGSMTAAPSRKGGMKSVTMGNEGRGEQRNFPLLLDDQAPMDGAAPMAEAAPSAPPAAPYKEVPSFTSLKVPSAKVAPATTPMKEVLSPTPTKVPPSHDN